MRTFTISAALLAAACSVSATAQDAPQAAPPIPASPEHTVFDGDYLSVGAGAAYGPSYEGSDDYVLYPLPIVQGRVKGIGIQPRPAGIALDLIPHHPDGVNFSFGPTVSARFSRHSQIKDPVVAAAGKLKEAIEVGAAAGVSVPKLLNPYDSLSFNVDAEWDVNGAYKGMVWNPSVTYFTPLSRGIAASLTLNAEHGDDKFANYYFSVSPAQSAASGLPTYTARSGWSKAGANLLMGFDLDGDLANGGWAIVAVGGYSRMLGDAKASPYTSIRGSADQWFGALGIGYTF